MLTAIQHCRHYLSKLSRRKKIAYSTCLLLLTGFYFCLPSPLFNDPYCYVLLDKKGELLNATISADGQWRFPQADTLPQKFVACITTFEDKRFFYHPGVDPFAFCRAFWKNITGSGSTQGGSTLTMQVMRLAAKTHRRHLGNKLIETVQAMRLECKYSKQKILTLYAAHAPFGGNVVGLPAAAWRYYGVAPQQLSWGQMATLAVLPNAPALVHPGKNRATLLKKRNALLQQLVAAHKLSRADGELAMSEPLPGVPLALPQAATHLLQRYKKQFPANGAVIPSTLDAGLQKNVAALVQQHHRLQKNNGINNAAALVLEIATGHTLAYVGNISGGGQAELEAEVDVIVAPRSPGSTLKPLLYAAALSDGLILPHSLLPDIPMQLGNYTPQNFDLTYDGAVPASNALSRSLNVPAVKLLQQYKYQRFYELLKNIGFANLGQPAQHYGLSLILGGCEASLWELAASYAALAHRLNQANTTAKKNIPLAPYQPVFLQSGSQPVNGAAKNFAAPFDEVAIYFTLMAMKEVMRPGDEGLWQQFGSATPIAWKTGTSFGFRDGWAIGLNKKYVVAVWVGNTDGEGRPGLTGIKTAAPIMFDIFRQLPPGGWFTQPLQQFVYLPVCRQSGNRAGLHCSTVDTVYCPPKGERSAICPYHKSINVDATAQYRVTTICESTSSMVQKNWFVLSPAMEYYYKQKNADYQPLPPFKPGCNTDEIARAIELIYPQPGAQIYVPLQLNGQRSLTIFNAAHRNSEAKIFWSIDDEFITTTQRFHQIAVNPGAGRHLLTLVDETGYSISREFEIIEKDP
jgi:penicillin-binding protein 1C